MSGCWWGGAGGAPNRLICGVVFLPGSPAAGERSVPSPNIWAVSDFGPDLIAVVPLLPLRSFYCFMRNWSYQSVWILFGTLLWMFLAKISRLFEMGGAKGTQSAGCPITTTSSEAKAEPVSSSELCPGPRIQSCCCCSFSSPNRIVKIIEPQPEPELHGTRFRTLLMHCWRRCSTPGFILAISLGRACRDLT